MTDFDWTRPHAAARAKRNEIQTFARMLLRDPEYRANLAKALRNRTIAPSVEQMLYAYAYGKPVERVELGRVGDFQFLEDLSDEQLAERARMLADALSGNQEAMAKLAERNPEYREDLEQLKKIDDDRLKRAEEITDAATFEVNPDLEVPEADRAPDDGKPGPAGMTRMLELAEREADKEGA